MSRSLKYVPERKGRWVLSVLLVLSMAALCIQDYYTHSTRDAIAEAVPKVIQKSQEGIERIQEKPVVQKLMQTANSVPEDPQPIYLQVGQTEEEVRGLLGDPTATLSGPGRTIWKYGDKSIEFVEGKLIAPNQITASEADDAGESLFVPMEKGVRSHIKRAGEWASELAGDIESIHNNIVLLNKSGVPTHKGFVAMIKQKKKGSGNSVVPQTETKESAVVLRKVNQGEKFFERTEVVGSQSL